MKLSRNDELVLFTIINEGYEAATEQYPDSVMFDYTFDMESAKELLVESNQGLVHTIIKKHTGKGLSYDELFSMASSSLWVAICNFNYTSGLKFSTYATECISMDVTKYFFIHGVTGSTVRLSEASARKVMMLHKAEIALRCANCEEPTNVELADYLGISLAELEAIKVIADNQMPASISNSNEESEEESEDHRFDALSVREARIDDLFIDDTFYGDVSNIIIDTKILTVEEKTALLMNCGYFDGVCYKVPAIAEKLGLDVKVVRKYISNAKKKLYDLLCDKGYGPDFAA